MEISGDFDSRKFAISFKDKEYISPEIFIEIRLNPGETRRWNRFYQLQRQETRQNFTLKKKQRQAADCPIQQKQPENSTDTQQDNT